MRGGIHQIEREGERERGREERYREKREREGGWEDEGMTWCKKGGAGRGEGGEGRDGRMLMT